MHVTWIFPLFDPSNAIDYNFVTDKHNCFENSFLEKAQWFQTWSFQMYIGV